MKEEKKTNGQCTKELKDLNRQLGEESEKREAVDREKDLLTERLKALWEVSSFRTMDMDKIYDHTLSRIISLTKSQYGFFDDLNEEETAATQNAFSKDVMKDCRTLTKAQKFPIAEAGIWAEAVRQRKTLIFNDYEATHHPAKKGLPEGHVPLTRLLVVPVFSGDRIISVAAVANKKSDYTETDAQQLRAFLTSVRIILDERKAQEKLRRSEERFRLLVEGAKDYAIFMLDPEGRVLTWNAGAEHMKGYQEEEILGRHISLFYEQKDIDSGKPEQALQIAASEGRFEEEGTRVRKDGSTFSANVLITALRDEDGSIRGFSKVTRNITAKKKMEEKFHHSQKMEAIGVLAGGVAHDFNNLLTAIMGNADLALMEIGENNPLHGNIQEILKAGKRAVALTRQLLAFSRKQTMQPEIVNLNEILAESEKMLRRLIGEDIDFLTVYEQEPWHVYADPGQIDQVLMNLVVNARDAMPKGGKLTIETANVELGEVYFHEHGVESAPGQYVMLAVTDTGTGMDRKTQARIFEPFFTTKERGRGTGLGLSTVFGIVKQNKGHIWVYSEPGEGTTFKVYLPRLEREGKMVGEEKSVQGQLRGSETVLVVEDDEMLRNMAGKMLEAYGYKVLVARNGKEALKIAVSHDSPIHLMLTDVVMPGMDGRELAQQIQAEISGIKVLYMSGYTDDAIAHHGVLNTGLNFMQKPFSAEGLGRKLREVLGVATKDEDLPNSQLVQAKP